MVRILQVVTHMNRGGLETMIMNYYRQINRKELQFDFLVHREERAAYDDEIESLGGKIYRLPILNPFSKVYKKKLNDFFVRHPEYEIIHVHQDCMSSVILKVATKHGIKIKIAHSHCASQDKNLKYLLKIYYMKQIPKYADCLFACGNDAGKWMFGEADFEVLSNAINANDYKYSIEKRKKARAQLGIGEKAFVVGHIGRFNHQKNHSFLIDIFRCISERENAKLLLIGDGSLRKEIEKKIEKENLKDKIMLLGIRDDVDTLLQAMDVFVFPSLYEGLPVTLIEAQAAGLPCIISDKVSLECKKTDLVQQIALSSGADVWAERVINASRIDRRDTYEEIKDSGYDIRENAKRLQKFYLRAAKGEKKLCLY